MRKIHVPMAYQRPEWIDIACAAGIAKGWGTLLIEEGDRPLGIIPLRKKSPWSAEVVTAFCRDFPPLLIDPDKESQFWSAAAGWLLDNPALRLVSFGQTHDLQRRHLFQQIMRKYGLIPFLRFAEILVHIELPASWEVYLRGLGHSTRDNVRYAESLLRRAYPQFTVVMLTQPDACLEALEDLMAMYRMRWGRQVGGSFFGDQHNVDYYRQVVRWGAENGLLSLPILRIGDKTIAAATVFLLPGGEMADVHVFARDPDALPKKFSPGIVLFSHLIRRLINLGVSKLSMGTGNTTYKCLLGGVESPQSEMLVARTPHEARALPALDRALHITARIPAHLLHHVKKWGLSPP